MPLPLKKSRRKKSTDAHSEPWWLANMPTMVYECSHDVSVVVVREIADIIKAWKLFCTQPQWRVVNMEYTTPIDLTKNSGM